ncbi:S8 family peptidase [Methylocystis sp. L43]|uniref:S8 family serine peptidase n=1 Tax=unclassified Methylocystis TaxID=2625913 RepID=UPI0018C2A9FA|nr:S8 family peptidase [Methylocystis sp. L43]MBG0806093.1 S8 family peptidase [Methylocystis sp. H15]
MAERPLLQIPESTRNGRIKKAPAPVDPNAKISRPGPQSQGQRLGPRFDRLRQVAAQSASQATMSLRADPDAIAPERAIVFEVAGSLGDFYSQAGRITGLEFLLEDDVELSPDDNFHIVETKQGAKVRRDESIGGRLYMAMPDLRALQEILRLWEIYSSGQSMPWGFSPWKTLFDLLRDVRAWGPTDRVLPETLNYWRKRIKARPEEPVRFEVELWFHKQTDRRARAALEIGNQVAALGGQVVSSAAIEPIRYHGMLVDLPAQRVTELLEHPNVTLARLDDIMYLRPQSVALFPNPDDLPEEPLMESSGDPPQGTPIAGLLDGVPLANHVRLAGRIILDDPEDFGARTPAARRAHGTSMASLIVHGDLQAGEPPLARPVYVRPVMIYNVVEDAEMTPPEKLPLDIIYIAVRRLLAGEGNEPASAPSIIVLNLSLGDLNRPFAGRMSPWARLIDWLSFQHRVLFLVSAGNVRSWLPVPEFSTRADFDAATPEAREAAIISALDREKAFRSLLSPAEGINALAVGAWHADAFENPPEPLNLTDPFPNCGLPNVSSGVGLGYRRIVKPDILFDGGRELVRASEDEGHIWLTVDGGGSYAGQLAATADSNATGRLNLQRRTVGTSNATALLTRSAVQIYDGLLDAGYEIPRAHAAVLLKALLVHGAAWGEAGERLEEAFGPPGRDWQRHRDNISRFLGYGRPDIGRVLDCSAERATLFAYGDIIEDVQDEFDIPLPPSLEGFTQVRRLTITLAWLTPINPRHQQYRAATLEVVPNGDDKFSLAVGRIPDQPTLSAINRGTVSHCVFEGDRAIAFLDEGFLRLRVTCRGQAGSIDERVPFALAISLETAVGSGIAVYDEVRAAVQTAVRAAAGGSMS